MKHYWILICAGHQIDETTRFYRVAIGTSKQADRDFLFLTAFAESHNYFFEKDCVEVSDFYMKCVKSAVSCQNRPDFATNIAQQVDARNLVRAIKKSESLPISKPQLENFSHQMHFLSLNYRIFSNLNRREAESAKR